jgi:hypothetical protein
MPVYRSITRVSVGNGQDTSFWWDAWLGDFFLAAKFQILYSHCSQPHCSVQQVVQLGINHLLSSRLSAGAVSELLCLNQLMDQVMLTDQMDKRTSNLISADGRLSTAAVYKAAVHTQHTSPVFSFVWKSKAPQRVKFFAWLLLQDRIQNRCNLLKKHIVDNSTCELCKVAPETSEHLIFHCPVANQLWTLVLGSPMSFPPINELWNLSRPPSLPPKHYNTFVLLCCWCIWNHRHDVVFRQMRPCLQRLSTACRQTCHLWACRLKNEDSTIPNHWSSVFPP